jgi:hypothetical protein
MSTERPDNSSGSTYFVGKKCDDIERLRITRAFWLSIFGLMLAVALIPMLLLAGIRAASEIVSIVGVFTSVLGTIVGAFFGLQVGSAGKGAAERRADNAQRKVELLAAAADEATINKARQLDPALFR